MRELPILFNTEMVRKLLSGYKTKTRRVIKYQPGEGAELISENLLPETVEAGAGAVFAWSDGSVVGAPYAVGDILYVREAWQHIENGRYIYRADKTDRGSAAYYNEYARLSGGWRPSIHMPKKAARIFLRVTDVRLERLRDITEAQAQAEGCFAGHFEIEGGPWGAEDDPGEWTAKEQFSSIWNETIKPADRNRYGWPANPWVWVIEFERCEKPEEESAKC